ncbi:efflux RND transporter periplasmic adaptor subunit [Altererythrobacter soli]|uniref:Efflux RND transporter periplasmic adaptor subunit n=1 Tax=Croceibacterium soli TaxID=1739690 RepID=A0A6I4UWT6_9SPHN|nr:efflux RND transporter periplasmic adaptor subunit [Croceibacterium soli]MXP42023.1 efflux RND transporter periplasmic adaptor subunit [Croceibacterium soli]
MKRVLRWAAPLALVGASALALGACRGPEAQAEAPVPVEVLVTKVRQSPIELSDELPGRVVAYRIAEIRPQVSGVVQRRHFEQGAAVGAGQPLFQINPAPFRADANSAAAALTRAEATYARARTQAERLQPLVDADAISGQAYDDAVAARDQAAADVAQARAELARRRLDLRFARVASPISGQIGPALVTEGALVSPQDANPLATVQQIDRVYVDVRQPVERFQLLREALAEGQGPGSATAEILSPSGRPYPVSGRILFSDVTVDPGTGNAIVRVLVNNSQRLLLPGMYVRARLPRMRIPDALTVPQQAVTRDPGGNALVGVIDGQGRVQPRKVILGNVVDGNYVVKSGLKVGDTIVVVGMDRVQPGTPVNPQPWQPRAIASQR